MSSIERYLKVRFKPRIVNSLKASYTGPKKLKKSGKAVGTKKKKLSGKKSAGKKPNPKVRTATKRNKGKKTVDDPSHTPADSVWKPIKKRK